MKHQTISMNSAFAFTYYYFMTSKGIGYWQFVLEKIDGSVCLRRSRHATQIPFCVAFLLFRAAAGSGAQWRG